uniref:Uncharacterized protein n=1 Tax=Tetradesmus obliquus TaxID=3088 RepID=A0A383VLC9_TETOB|eukprot:jgi/Sobl393_1/17267/SZX65196.1
MQLGCCPEALQRHVWAQVQQLQCSQSQPFEAIIADYMALMTRNRELEVRVGVLDKEAAELRDEAAALSQRLAAFDEAAVRDFAAKAEGYRAQLQRANSELTSLLRDKSKAYEELLSLQRQNDNLKAANAEAAEAAELASGEISGLKARLAEVSRALDDEKEARQLAAAEAEARVGAKVAAEAEAERLRADNAALEARLHTMVAREAERLEQINKMHEEMMDNAKRQQVEAGAASQLLGLLTRRRGSTTPAAASAATTPSDTSAAASRRTSLIEAAAGSSAAAAAAGGAAASHGQLLWGSLKQKMGLPEGAVGHLRERQLPAAPTKFVQAHAGGCCSLSFQPYGHLVASCGMDKTVQTWDLNTSSHTHTYHGLLGSANDVAFSSDGRRLLGAGGDKRLLVWNTGTGQMRVGLQQTMLVRNRCCDSSG